MTQQDVEPDLIIVGGGLAGLVAGVRAAELGLRPVVLEQGDSVDYPCNSRQSGGILHIAFHDPYRTTQELVDVIARVSGGEARDDLAQALAMTGARLIAWLQGQGARFMRFNPQEGYRWCMSPPRALRAGIDWRGRGPDVVMRQLADSLVRLGGSLRLGTRVTGLLMEDGRCHGVKATCDGQTREWRAPYCVLADGGFQANRLLVERFITPRFDALFQRGARSGHGDGLLMAQAAGAALSDCSRFYGHLLCSDARHNDQVWPYPEVDSIATAGIVVDDTGRRIVDEGRTGVSLANELATRTHARKLFAVFDASIWSGPGTTARIPANPLLEKAGGTILRADSVGALALLMDVPADALEQTLGDYNQALDAGSLHALGVARSTAVKPWPVRDLPLMAIPICPGITYTMGGIEIDAQAQVLDESRTPIAGLFAAGATTGGIEGGVGSAYIGGLIKAGSFGLLAAERIATLQGKAFSIARPSNSAATYASDEARATVSAAPAANANATATSAAAAAASGLARFPMLRAIVRQGRVAAPVLAAGLGVVVLAVAWPFLQWLALPLALALGVTSLVVLITVVELVTLVTEFLMPD